MAEANPVENLRGETTCPVCREYYTDPVTTLCGHNFCRPCITQYWGHLTANFPCPECRHISRKDTVHPNRLLANIVQIAKGFSLEDTLPQVEKECGKHREKLRLFCRTDQKSICVVCRDAREHRAHDVVPIDEAGEEYKEKLKNWLNPLKQEKKEIQEHQSNVEKRARTLKNQVERERRRTLAEFDRMYQILRNKEQVLLCRLEEMDVKIRVAREANMLKLSDEIALLDKLIVEMEEKASWPVEDFLQDVRSALKRCENVKFRKPEETRKNYKVFATMDPKTAHPQLVLSKDGRSVRCAVDPRQMQPRSLQRFTSTLCVVGCEEFTSGRHYWEMEATFQEEGPSGMKRLCSPLQLGPRFPIRNSLPGFAAWPFCNFSFDFFSHSNTLSCIFKQPRDVLFVQPLLDFSSGEPPSPPHPQLLDWD